MVLHGMAWYRTILRYLAISCAILHYLALSCVIFHYLAHTTCSQQMSPVIAFDIALVAQKVKVQYCYIMADMLNLHIQRKKMLDGPNVEFKLERNPT